MSWHLKKHAFKHAIARFQRRSAALIAVAVLLLSTQLICAIHKTEHAIEGAQHASQVCLDCVQLANASALPNTSSVFLLTAPRQDYQPILGMSATTQAAPYTRPHPRAPPLRSMWA